MTERELLKNLVNFLDNNCTRLELLNAVEAARRFLKDTEPPPEHPAVAAYNKMPAKWAYPSGAFLAGWRKALEWASGCQGTCIPLTQKWLKDCANATPTQLP